MRTHIDWLTFTMRPIWSTDIPEGGFEDAYINSVMDAFLFTFGEKTATEAFAGVWEKRERSRAPYTDSWTLGENGITIFASPALNHCCVEISGSGCESLIERNVLNKVLTSAKDSITRIDIACDIETAVTPTQFVADLSHKRMRASGYQRSETGETHYVGSQKSERYARVYRYNPPHPRAHMLRIEHVFRKEYARVVAKGIINTDVEVIATAAGNAFGWNHPVWTPEYASRVDISVQGGNKRGNATLHWLVNVCAPSFKKMVKEGVITDQMGFIQRYFLAEE